MRLAKCVLTSLAAALAASTLLISVAEAKDTGFKLMMTPKWTGFPYYEASARGAKAAADELGDIFVYAGADHADVSLQVETLTNFVTQRADGIILAAIDLNAVAPILKRARKKGIVVTTYDADAAVPARDMFINQMSYEQAARVMLDCALLDAPGGGEIAFIAASPTSPNHMAQIRIMTELTKTEAKYKGFKVVDTRCRNKSDAGPPQSQGHHLAVGRERTCCCSGDRCGWSPGQGLCDWFCLTFGDQELSQ
jgi:rhamnose transport system substrate-binding protein